jgi:DNA-binding FadR family transcriptional regulator
MDSLADRSTLVDDTANRIRQMILTGQIKPGELLPPRRLLAVQFAVGIATIHEAVKSLAAVGLLESRPGKGTWVSANALDSVIHPATILNRFGAIDTLTLYEARLALEVAIAELAAQKATPDEVQRMLAALEAGQKVIDDDVAFVQADWEFHRWVAQAPTTFCYKPSTLCLVSFCLNSFTRSSVYRKSGWRARVSTASKLKRFPVTMWPGHKRRRGNTCST